MIKYYLKTINELTQNEIRQLKKLCFIKDSRLKRFFEFDLNDIKNRENVSARYFMAKQEDRVLGWLRLDSYYSRWNKPEAMLYVRKKFRRQGIGTVLMKMALDYNGGKIEVIPHDAVSKNFFEKIGICV